MMALQGIPTSKSSFSLIEGLFVSNWISNWQSVNTIIFSEKSRRESKLIVDSLSPIWNEHFIYEGLSESSLYNRVLEVFFAYFSPKDLGNIVLLVLFEDNRLGLRFVWFTQLHWRSAHRAVFCSVEQSAVSLHASRYGRGKPGSNPRANTPLQLHDPSDRWRRTESVVCWTLRRRSKALSSSMASGWRSRVDRLRWQQQPKWWQGILCCNALLHWEIIWYYMFMFNVSSSRTTPPNHIA